MPFNPDEYLAEKTATRAASGGFDPDAYLSEKASQQEEDISALESGVRGGVQGLSLGFADEVTGAAKAGWNKVTGSDESLFDLYTKARDEARARDAAAAEANPLTYNLSQVGGSVASSFIPGLNVAKGATLGAKLGAGALQGGAMALGGSEGDLTKGEVGTVALDTLKGAGAGAAFTGAAEKVANSIAPASKYLRDKAEQLAVLHLRPTAQMKRVLGVDKLRAAGREALDSDAIRFGQNADDTAARLGEMVDEVGAVKGDIVNASDAKVDPRAIADRFENEVIAPLRGTSEAQPLVAQLEQKKADFLAKYAPDYVPGGRKPGSPTVIRRHSEFIPEESTVPFEQGTKQIGETVTPNIETRVVENEVPGAYGSQKQSELQIFNTGETRKPINAYSTPDATPPFKVDPATGLPIKRISESRLEAVPEVPQMSPAQIEAEKIAVNDNINYLTDPKAKQQAQMGFAGVLKRSAEDVIDDPNFKRVKDAYGNLATAQTMADRTGALQSGGLMSHITDVGIGAEALNLAAHGSPAGIPMAVARGLTKGRVASSAAVTADRLSKMLATAPQRLGRYAEPLRRAAERGTNSLAVTHFLLSQKNDDYRSTVENMGE